MTITERIDALIQEKGLSRRQLAIAANIPPSSLQSAMERGRNITVDMVEALASALKVTPTYLIGYDEKIVKPEQYAPEELVEIKAEAWAAYQQHIAETTGPRARANAAMARMDEEGQTKVADYAEDILPRYRAETTTQPTPATPEGKDATPPGPGPETAEKGE